MDFAQNHQRDRKGEQGVQTTDKTHGNCAGRGVLLPAFGLHLIEDGVALASKPCRESQGEFTLLQADQRKVNLHKKLYTTEVGGQ